MSNKVALTQDALNAHLVEQLGFLKRSADAFDEGYEDEAKRMATVIRVLVHNTSNSHALLHQLGTLNATLFLDTALPEIPENLATYSGLTSAQGGKGRGKYVALLDDFERTRTTNFESWWGGIVFRDAKNQSFSRKDIVLTAANQDGGAHVDPSLNASYDNLKNNNSLNWFSGSYDGDVSPLKNPERAAIRQIAHEVLKTLEPGYSKKIAREGFMVAGLGLQVSTSAVNPPAKMGRNERCFCGSGRKFKKCHGKMA